MKVRINPLKERLKRPFAREMFPVGGLTITMGKSTTLSKSWDDPKSKLPVGNGNKTYRIHAHLVDLFGKFRQTYHTWMLWEINNQPE